MSVIQFFASDTPLPEYDNGIITADGSRLRGKNRRRITVRNELEAMRLFSDSTVDRYIGYSKAPHIVYFEGFCTPENTAFLYRYLIRHMETASYTEIWNVWEGLREKPVRYAKTVSDFRERDLARFWGNRDYEQPEVLVLTRK